MRFAFVLIGLIGLFSCKNNTVNEQEQIVHLIQEVEVADSLLSNCNHQAIIECNNEVLAALKTLHTGADTISLEQASRYDFAFKERSHLQYFVANYEEVASQLNKVKSRLHNLQLDVKSNSIKTEALNQILIQEKEIVEKLTTEVKGMVVEAELAFKGINKNKLLIDSLMQL